jgi:hypothetical protein
MYTEGSMMRRAAAVLLLLGALALILAPAVSAAVALIQGQLEEALYYFAPLLLLPLGFLTYGVVSSLRHGRGHGEPLSR